MIYKFIQSGTQELYQGDSFVALSRRFKVVGTYFKKKIDPRAKELKIIIAKVKE